jgi:hypothetical protein
MDFFHDLAKILENELTRAGYVIPHGRSDESLVRDHLNVLHRLIPTKPRTILESPNLICPPNLRAGYEEVKRKASVGESLVPHQSRLLDDLEYRDPLLNDWGIHHLHLGTSLESHGYVTRTGPVLFARVTDDSVFAIQIYTHGAWSKREIVEILHRNWPDSIERYRVKGITLQTQFTDREIGNLRDAGVQAFIQVDNSVYAPIGGGIVTSGDSMRVIMASDQIRRSCHQLEQMTTALVDREASRGNKLPGSDFRLTRHAGKAVVVEQSARLELFSVDWLLRDQQ